MHNVSGMACSVSSVAEPRVVRATYVVHHYMLHSAALRCDVATAYVRSSFSTRSICWYSWITTEFSMSCRLSAISRYNFSGTLWYTSDAVAQATPYCDAHGLLLKNQFE